MKGSRPLPCALLICFAIATQVALGPVAGGGCDALDVPLLLLLWFALVDRFGRVLAIAGAIGASRLMWGVSTPVEVFAPLASAVLWIRFARNGVDPRDAGRRIALVTFALAIAGVTHRVLWSVSFQATVDTWAQGLLIGTIGAILLFPILDQTIPFVRSATHPM